MSTHRTPSLRSVSRLAHRWLGIVVGLYFIFLGLSGSWLVYKETFDVWIKPELRVASVPTPAPDLAGIVEGARRGVGVERWPTRIVIPAHPRRNPVVSFNLSEPGGPRRFADVHVDAATADFRGAESFRATLSGFLFITHHELFGGKLGHGLVAVGGLLCLVLLASGLVVAWPKPFSWRAILGWRRPRTTLLWHRELHRVAGVYGLLLMILVTATGTYLARPAWFGPEPTRSPRTRMTETGDPARLNEGLRALAGRLAEAGVPVRGAELRLNPELGTIELESKAVGSRYLYSIDSAEFAPVAPEAPRAPVDAFLRVSHELHVGEFWGEFGRALVFLSGLLPLFFYVTGFYFWVRTRARSAH